MLVKYVNQQAYFAIKICWKTSKERQIKFNKNKEIIQSFLFKNKYNVKEINK